jgi:hypothetical protein
MVVVARVVSDLTLVFEHSTEFVEIVTGISVDFRNAMGDRLFLTERFRYEGSSLMFDKPPTL